MRVLNGSAHLRIRGGRCGGEARHHLQVRLQVTVLPHVVHGAPHKGDGPALHEGLPGSILWEPHRCLHAMTPS